MMEKLGKKNEHKTNSKDGNPLESANILVVEDNLINQKVIMSIIKKEGANVMIASNGQEGIEALAKNSIDIILMDIQMPVMDGITATKKIRLGAAGQNKKEVPVIAVTAHAIKVDKKKCLNAGMNGYITKPVRPDILKAEIIKFLLEMRQD